MSGTSVLLALFDLTALTVSAVLAVLGVALAGLLLALERDTAPQDGDSGYAPAGPVDLLRPGARDMLSRLPVPLFLIEANGLVSYANTAALEMFPRLKGNRHFSSVLRAPAFLDTVGAILRGETQAESDLPVTLPGRELFLRIHFSRLPGQHVSVGDGPVLVVIEDHTRDRRLDQLRTDFVANASHELRTPLTAIIGFIDTLRDRARDDPEARDKFLGIMAQQAARMERLVDDLMSLNRVEMSEHTPPRDRFELSELVCEAVAAVSPIARQRGTALTVEMDGFAAEVTGDRGQLIQVFVNLIDNALKHGGKAKTVTVESRAASQSYPGMQGVAVRDEGPGIAREHIPRLTERFYRISEKASRSQGGTGLGLAIVKHVLNRHGGELQVESQLGTGSRFTIWLPAQALDPAQLHNTERTGFAAHEVTALDRPPTHAAPPLDAAPGAAPPDTMRTNRDLGTDREPDGRLTGS
ncbi:MAG: ATP-binding protein [Pseudomonadota bacterium]